VGLASVVVVHLDPIEDDRVGAQVCRDAVARCAWEDAAQLGARGLDVLGPHLLTSLLRGRLEPGARVIWVSSGGMYGQRLHADDLEYEHGEYKPTTGYARTKRAQVVLSELWADELREDAVVVHAMHPGWADTPGIATSLPGFRRLTRPILRTNEQGADTVVWLAAADAPLRSTGRFWHDRRERPTHYTGRTKEGEADRRALWEACERLTT